MNPDVRTAGLRIMEARAQLGIAGSALYPQVQQATLLGRKQYEEFAAYWPTSDDEFADVMNNAKKYVPISKNKPMPTS